MRINDRVSYRLNSIFNIDERVFILPNGVLLIIAIRPAVDPSAFLAFGDRRHMFERYEMKASSVDPDLLKEKYTSKQDYSYQKKKKHCAPYFQSLRV